MLATLADDPARLGDLIARPETWRDSAAAERPPDLVERVPLPGADRKARRGAPARLSAPRPDRRSAPRRRRPLKLYQPAHQRYYLVAGEPRLRASRACPSARSAAAHEQVSFVLRRLLPAIAGAAGRRRWANSPS